jgi:Xaa-Pro aminopeptidase
MWTQDETMNDYTGRIARLQEVLREQGAGLAVLSWTDQMRYLTGYLEGAHERLLALFVPAQGEAAFVVPSMNAQQARANPAGIGQVLGWTDSETWQPAVQQLLTRYALADGAKVLIDDELHSVHLLDMQHLFPNLRYEPAGATLAKLRGLKTDGELASLESAAILIDTVFEETVAHLQEGLTETELQEFVFAAIKRHHSTPSFTPLICFGANGAMPHHHTDNTPLHQGDMVVIDIGCTWENYCSDITRTVAFGEPSDVDARKVYQIVSDAHYAARQTVRPGVTCGDVDAAARKVIEAAGYGAEFFHRTGHGIGLSCHEPPNISADNPIVLAPGMCFSIEPGIYLAERFGVRIENIVSVTAEGVRSLNADPARELRVV